MAGNVSYLVMGYLKSIGGLLLLIFNFSKKLLLILPEGYDTAMLIGEVCTPAITIPEMFFQPEQADDSFALVDLAQAYPIDCVNQRQLEHLQKLAVIQLALLQRQPARQKIFHALVGI